MAPEVFEEKYSTKADIWGVGCVGFQMMAGIPPWKNLGLTNPIALFRHVQKSTGLPDFEYSQVDSALARKELEVFKKLLSLCFDRDPTKRPDASSLLSNSFFLEEHTLSDDEDFCSRSLFSPASTTVSKSGLQSPMQTIGSPLRGSLARRKSAGCIFSPLMSPPVPKHVGVMRSPLPKSPMPDPRGWPAWAREKHQQAASVEEITSMMDSLAYSDDTKSRSMLLACASGNRSDSTSSGSPLLGMDFLSKS